MREEETVRDRFLRDVLKKAAKQTNEQLPEKEKLKIPEEWQDEPEKK